MNAYIALPRTFFFLGFLIFLFITVFTELDSILFLWPFFYSFLYVLNSNLAYIYDESWIRSTGIIKNIEILSYFHPRSYIEVYIKVFTLFPNSKFFAIDVSIITVFILGVIFISKKEKNTSIKAKKVADNAEQKQLAKEADERRRQQAIKNEKSKNYDETGVYETDSSRSIREKKEWSPPVSIICLKWSDVMKVKLKSFSNSEKYIYRCINCGDERKLLNSDL